MCLPPEKLVIRRGRRFNSKTDWPELHKIMTKPTTLLLYPGPEGLWVLSFSRSESQEKKPIPIFGYFWVFKEYPQNSQIWKSETSPNLGTWLGIPWLGLVSLCQIWDFYGYSLNTPKYPKMEIGYFLLWIGLMWGETQHAASLLRKGNSWSRDQLSVNTKMFTFGKFCWQKLKEHSKIK